MKNKEKIDHVIKFKANEEVVNAFLAILNAWKDFKEILDDDGRVWWIEANGEKKVFLEFDVQR